MMRGAAILILLAMPAVGDDASALAERAVAQFRAADALLHEDPVAAREGYLEALKLFETLVAEHGARNAAVYHNLGNACYLAGDMGRAIFNYRQALRFDPGDAETQRNLAEARKRRRDIIQTPAEPRMFRTALFWHYDFPVRTRAGLFLVAYVLAWGFAATRLFWRRDELRWGVVGCACAAFLLAASLLSDVARSAERTEGVVLAPEIMPRKAEGAVHEAALAGPLHAGAEFVVTEIGAEWCAIALADGRAGWVPRSAVAFLE